MDVRMSSGVPHDITVSLVTIPGRGDFYQVRDTAGDSLAAGSRCLSINSRVVRCARAPIASLRATGGAKNDRIVVDATFRSGTLISGNTGRDTILGSPGVDNIFGEGHGDILFGRNGDDYIKGGDDIDYLDSGPGQDSIFGDNDNDIWFAEAASDARTDVFSGGAGDDTATYQKRTQPVSVSLNGRPDDGAAFAERDNILADVENITGGAGNDLLTGSNGGNRIIGNGGNDTIDGLDARDRLYGDAGNDAITGGKGRDDMVGGAGNDRLFGKDFFIGNDSLDGWTGTDTCQADLLDTKTRCEA